VIAWFFLHTGRARSGDGPYTPLVAQEVSALRQLGQLVLEVAAPALRERLDLQDALDGSHMAPVGGVDV